MRSTARPQRRSVNLTLPATLIAQARAAGLNLSGIAEAAIEAELRSGRREETVEQAKRHLLFRLARIAALADEGCQVDAAQERHAQFASRFFAAAE